MYVPLKKIVADKQGKIWLHLVAAGWLSEVADQVHYMVHQEVCSQKTRDCMVVHLVMYIYNKQ